jgi:putative ABC transport system substrate-binding protein
MLGTGAAGLGLLAGCGRWPWQGQAPSKVPRIGYLVFGSPNDELSFLREAFQQGLHDHGYVQGQNILMEYRFAEGRLDRLSALAAELVGLQVDVLYAGGSQALQAARSATATIPIVSSYMGDPVGAGIVASLAKPGGNVTGLSNFAPKLGGKRLELLKEAVPGTSRVVYLSDPANPGDREVLAELQSAGQALGIDLQSVLVGSPTAFAEAFEIATRRGADGLLVSGGAFFTSQRSAIVELTACNRLPAMYQSKEFVQAGGLMAYGPNTADLARRSAAYVDKILKGAKPGDLPIEQPMTFDFVVNLKTVQELGLTIPEEIRLQVTEVIQ